jgi:hypothetical protein
MLTENALIAGTIRVDGLWALYNALVSLVLVVAQSLWTTIYAWSACFVVTMVLSLRTSVRRPLIRRLRRGIWRERKTCVRFCVLAVAPI